MGDALRQRAYACVCVCCRCWSNLNSTAKTPLPDLGINKMHWELEMESVGHGDPRVKSRESAAVNVSQHAVINNHPDILVALTFGGLAQLVERSLSISVCLPCERSRVRLMQSPVRFFGQDPRRFFVTVKKEQWLLRG